MYKTWEYIKNLISIDSYISYEKLQSLAPVFLSLFVIIAFILFIYWMKNNFNKKFKEDKPDQKYNESL